MTNIKGGKGVEDAIETVDGMPSFIPSVPATRPVVAEGNSYHTSGVSEFGALDPSSGVRVNTGVNFTRKDPLLNVKSSGQAIASNSLRFGAFSKFENWGESTMADHSPRTDTSTDVDADERNQMFDYGHGISVAASDSSDRSKGKTGDQKTLRRLAQNREAARKSRLRKKAYVQQLENNRLKLTQLEQEFHRARQHGIFISNSGDQLHSTVGNGALAFDIEYLDGWKNITGRSMN